MLCSSPCQVWLIGLTRLISQPNDAIPVQLYCDLHTQEAENIDINWTPQEFTHEDYARALMEPPAQNRLQFPDAPQQLAMEYSRGRPGGAPGEIWIRVGV